MKDSHFRSFVDFTVNSTKLQKGQVWADPTDATKRAHINGWSERQIGSDLGDG
jgi:hypothetical protein